MDILIVNELVRQFPKLKAKRFWESANRMLRSKQASFRNESRKTNILWENNLSEYMYVRKFICQFVSQSYFF